MNRPRHLLSLAAILAVAAFSIVMAWPGSPDRFFPDFLSLPDGGAGIGDRDSYRLGLDLAGGVSVTLEAAGEAVPVRRGETLNEFLAREGVSREQVVELNPNLEDIAEDEAGRPLPDAVSTIVLPLSLEGAELADIVAQSRDIIEERVNGFGVSEAEVTVVGEDRINAQIPGVDAGQASNLVGSTAQLEFREIDPAQPTAPPPVQRLDVIDAIDDVWNMDVREQPVTLNARVRPYFIPNPDEDVIIANGQRWISATAINSEGQQIQLTGRFLQRDSISRTLDNAGQPALTFGLDAEGGRLMEQITSRLAPSQALLGIFLDERLISAPAVNAVIRESGIITGLSEEDAITLRRQLRAGALPINFRVIQTTEVAATLGEDSVTDTVQAGLVAFLAIVVFMIIYYRMPGVMAALALIVYGAAVMTTFKLAPITMTLAGFAGLILSLGFAVDGNILIFERMKEELRLGRGLQHSIETGWARAWPAIRDANISTLITVLILWFFADALNANLIKSFALALLVGTAFSFLSVLFVTRVFLQTAVGSALARRPGFFGIREMALDVEQRRRGRAARAADPGLSTGETSGDGGGA